MGHCIYKIIDVDTNEIKYIGKSDTSLYTRLQKHAYKGRFNSIKNMAVYYAEFDSYQETEVMEKLMIAKYNPELNGVLKLVNKLNIEFTEPKFERYVCKYSPLCKSEISKIGYLTLFYNSIYTSIKNGNFKISNDKYLMEDGAPCDITDNSYIFTVNKTIIDNLDINNILYDFNMRVIFSSNNEAIIDCKDVFYFYKNTYSILSKLLKLIVNNDKELLNEYDISLEFLK